MGPSLSSRALNAERKNPRILLRIERETMLLIAEDAELAMLGVEAELECAALERIPVLRIENRNQHLALQFGFDRVPGDVKELGVNRGFAIFEDVEPPGAVTSHHAHMIGHDIEDLAHPVPVQFGHEMFVVFGAANFRIEGIVIDDVVAMQTARPRPQVGGGVAVTDAERRKIGNQFRGAPESKVTVELQPVGGGRNFRKRRHGLKYRLGASTRPRTRPANPGQSGVA